LLKELQVEMTPQQNWVAVSDAGCGLALLAPGQYESGVLDQPERPLVVTLLRAFRRAVFTDGNEGGQIPGTHQFVLGLAPFKAAPSEPVPAARLSRLAQTLASPVRCYFAGMATPPTSVPAADARVGAPRIEGDVVLSASFSPKKGEHLFRFFNPSNRAKNLKLAGGKNWTEIDLEGKPVRKMSAGGFEAGPHKIVSLRTTIA
jgi:alpha-mannosidase/mannosylglycerate hydrolase